MNCLSRIGGCILIMCITFIAGYDTISAHYIAKSTVGMNLGINSMIIPTLMNPSYGLVSDNGSVVFDANSPYGNHIFLYDSQTRDIIAITSGSTGFPQWPRISPDARYISFWSTASDLIPGDPNPYPDYFIYDRYTDTLTGTMNVWNEDISFGDSYYKISPDARFLLRKDNQRPLESLRVWDLASGSIQTIISGVDSNTLNHWDLSADGRYVSFVSSSSQFVSGDVNDRSDLFIYDREVGAITHSTIPYSGNILGYGWTSFTPDGRYVILYDGTLYDIDAGLTTSVASDAYISNARISPDGHYVVFSSSATGLVANDINEVPDLFIYDIDSGTIIGSTAYASAGPIPALFPYGSVSDHAKYIAHYSWTIDNNNGRTFIYDRDNDTITDLTPVINSEASPSYISPDGKHLVFYSQATNIVSGDTNGSYDLFFYNLDRQSPTLTLSGPATLSIPLHTTWIDPGVTWIDDIDGTGIILIPSSGYVDTTIPGTYILEYTYTDNAGNTGNAVTRTIIVQDPPISGPRLGGGGSKGSTTNDNIKDKETNKETDQDTQNNETDKESPSLFNPSISPSTCYSPLNQSTIDQQIPVSNYFKTAHQMLYSYGLTKRQGTKDYRPYDTLTRQEAAKFMVEFAQKVLCRKTTKTYTNNFNDIDNADPTLIPFIKASYEYNIFKGDANKDGTNITTFRPYDVMTTDELVAIMIRLVTNNIHDSDGEDWAKEYKELLQQLTSEKAGHITTQRGSIAETIYSLYRDNEYKLEGVGYVVG